MGYLVTLDLNTGSYTSTEVDGNGDDNVQRSDTEISCHSVNVVEAELKIAEYIAEEIKTLKKEKEQLESDLAAVNEELDLLEGID